MERYASLLGVLAALSGGLAWAETETPARKAAPPAPSAATPAAQPVLITPTPAPVDPTPKLVRIPGPPPGTSPQDAKGAATPVLRAVSLREGEGRLLVGGTERTVRPGDTLGRDVVKAVAPGRMVLSRLATGGRPAALVVVDFDSAGRSRTRVYLGPEAAPAPPPEVR